MPFPVDSDRASLTGLPLGPERAVLVPLLARTVWNSVLERFEADEGAAEVFDNLAGEQLAAVQEPLGVVDFHLGVVEIDSNWSNITRP